jgi:hypothetical protein
MEQRESDIYDRASEYSSFEQWREENSSDYYYVKRMNKIRQVKIAIGEDINKDTCLWSFFNRSLNRLYLFTCPYDVSIDESMLRQKYQLGDYELQQVAPRQEYWITDLYLSLIIDEYQSIYTITYIVDYESGLLNVIRRFIEENDIRTRYQLNSRNKFYGKKCREMSWYGILGMYKK